MYRPASRVKVFLSDDVQMRSMYPASCREYSQCHDDIRAMSPYQLNGLMGLGIARVLS
jgi:hypothetical protein